MKRIVIVCIFGRECEKKDEMHKKFGKYVSKNYLNYYNDNQIPFDADSSIVQEAYEFALENLLEPRLWHKVYYTKNELEKLPYFHLVLFDPLELEGTTPATYGTQYKGGCENCGFGAEIVGDLLIDRKFMKKSKIGSIRGHGYISEDMRRLIEENHLTGISFGANVIDYRGRDMPNYNLFTCKSILPPMSNKTKGINLNGYPCLNCGFDKTYSYSELEYEKEKFVDALDFNYSFEFLNNDCARYMIISSKVRKILKENKIRAWYEPIVILNE